MLWEWIAVITISCASMLLLPQTPRGASGSGGCAARGASAGKRAHTGPVWRASGPFVKEAWRPVNSVDEALAELVSRGHPVKREAGILQEGLKRLQAMLAGEIDEAEALQAASPPSGFMPVEW